MNCKIQNTLLAALLGLVMASSVHAACSVTGSAATPFQIGPPNPVNGFAEYIRDVPNNISLELCLDPTAFCFFDPVQPDNAFSSQIGFGFEGFWWLASPDTTLFPDNMRAVLVLGAEAAFLGEIVDGGQFPFTRLRVRLDLPVTGFYRVTEPYGVHNYEIAALVAGDEIFESFDVEFPQGSVDAAGAITEATSANNCVGPWLTWDTYPADPLLNIDGVAGADYIGDGTTPHRISSPSAVDYFRIEAFSDAAMTLPLNTFDPADADGNLSLSSVETNLFTVVGKIYDGRLSTPMVAGRTTYTRDATGTTGQGDVFAAGVATAVVSATGGPNLIGTFNLLTDLVGNFFESILLSPNAAVVPPVVEINAIDGGAAIATDPTHLVQPLVDLVSITRAEYDLGALPQPTLTVQATSSDSLAPLPALTVVGLNQPLTAGTAVITVTPPGTPTPGVPIAPPGIITVSSTAGGSATHLVEVINSDEDGDGIPNDEDNCPVHANFLQEDTGDGDGVGDACDNCTFVPNGPLLPDVGGNSQLDTDGDGYGNICDADLTQDNTVNLSDYSVFRSKFRSADPDADFNGDGVVNLSDYSIFRSLYRKAPGPSALAP